MNLRIVIPIMALMLMFSLGCLSSGEKGSTNTEFKDAYVYEKPDPALAGPPAGTIYISDSSDPYFYKIYLLSDGEYLSDYWLTNDSNVSIGSFVRVSDDRYFLISHIEFNYTCSANLDVDVEVSGDGFILAYINDPDDSKEVSDCTTKYDLYINVYYTTFPMRGIRIYGIKSADSDYQLMYARDFLRDINATDMFLLNETPYVN